MFNKKILFSNLIILLSLLLTAFASVAGAQASTSDQIIALKQGFNFVSFTVTPPATAAELKAKDLNIEDIYLYSAAAGSFLSASDGTLATLSMGKGYIIKAKAETNITINGPPAENIGDITLKKGFNLLGFSKLSPSSTINAFTKIMNSSSAISGIYKWSPAAGSFIQVVRDSEGNVTMLDGSDPALKPGEAYFVNVSEDTKINYDEDVKIPKVFTGLSAAPSSDTVATSGTYDLNKVKVYAVYSDGSSVEVTANSVFTTAIGKIADKTYTAPKYSTTAVITISYTDTATNILKECYFTLAVTNSGSTPVQTTTYRCSYKLAPKAKIIDEETITTESVSDTQIVLSVTNQSDIPTQNDILIGYHGNGYLRRVETVSSQNGKVYITTTQSRLESAFEELDYSYKGKLSTLHATDTTAPGSPEAKAVAKFLRSKSVMPAPAPDRSIISKDKLKNILEHASLTVSLTKADISFDPVLECDIEIGWFKLKKFLFVIGGNLACGVEFQVDVTLAASLPLKSELELFHSMPYVFAVGPVPFSFEWDITCGIDANASVTGSYKYSNDWTFAVRVGAEYDGVSWNKINNITRTSTATDDYELNGAVEIKPYISVGLALKIVGLAGPKVYLDVFLSFLAKMTVPDKADISVSAGVAARVAFVLEIMSWTLAEFDAELFSLTWEIYSRSIDFYVADPVIKPGGGSYTQDQTITITCATQDAIIRYTTDSSDPTPALGTIYSKPFTVSSSKTIKAIAYKSAKIHSKVIQADYAIRDVLISNSLPANIYYSCSEHTNGTICPDDCTANVYAIVATEYNEKSFTIPSTCTLNYKNRNVVKCYFNHVHEALEGVKISGGIREVVFDNTAYIKKLILPSTLTSYCFKNFSELYDVNIPENTSQIPDNAFYGCGKLASIAIPSGIKKIGSAAFASTSLAAIDLSSVTTVSENAFAACKLTEVTFGESINSIEKEAFRNNRSPKLYFPGNAPSVYEGLRTLYGKVYYKSSAAGWTNLINDVKASSPNAVEFIQY